MSRPLRLLRWLLLAGLLLSLAPAGASALGANRAIADPAATGPYGVVRTEFDMPTTVTVGVGAPGTAVTASGTLLNMRQAGDLFYPAAGKGPFPILVFEHGNHSTCQSGPGSSLGLLVDPTTAAATYANGTCSTNSATADQLLAIDEARSYQGYDYLAQQLASQGYIVVSLDINDITKWTNNAAESGYLARAEIISKTLDLISSWNTSDGPSGVGPALIGRVDSSRVGVMGHSRGGEGVNQFDEYNRTRPADAAAAASRVDPEHPTKAEPVPDFGPRYDLRAVFSLAPVDNQGARQPVITDTNFATLLPYCDGDVFDLEGAPVFERSQFPLTASGHAAAQYLIDGANHDYFNTVWTEDDANLFGFGDPNCNAEPGPTRLQPAEERAIGITLMGAWLRYYVGGEAQFKPIVDGAGLPPAACPTNAGPSDLAGVTCNNVVQTSYEAPDRRLLIGPTGLLPAVAPPTTPSGDAVTYTGFGTDPPAVCVPTAAALAVTTGCGASPNRSVGPQLTLAWNAAASVTVALTAADADISHFGALTFRASENFTDPTQPPTPDDVAVTLTDRAGHAATVNSATYSDALLPEPGTTARKQILNGVRIPLSAFQGHAGAPDLTRIKTITLGFGQATSPVGSIEFADLQLQEPVSDESIPADPGATGAAGSNGTNGSNGTSVGATAATCAVAGARFVFAIRPQPGIRAVRAQVRIDGRAVVDRRGHRLTSVAYRRPTARRFTVSLITTLSDGEVIARTVTVNGCRTSRPAIRVLHRVRGR